MLRDIIYIDNSLINSYLSTIEEGVINNYQVKESKTSPHWSINLEVNKLVSILSDLGFPLPKIGVNISNSEKIVEISESRTMTPEAQLSRLLKYIHPTINNIDSNQRDIWKEIDVKDILLINSNLLLPSGIKEVLNLQEGMEIYDLMQSMGMKDREMEKIDKESQFFREKFKEMPYFNIKIQTINNKVSNYLFASKIKKEFLKMEIQELDYQNCFVLCVVDKVLKQGEKYDVFDVTMSNSSKLINRKERRKLESKYFETLSKPSIVVKTIAIYKE